MMSFQIFIKKFASHYSNLQLYEIILKKRITFLEKKCHFVRIAFRNPSQPSIRSR